MLSGIYSLTKKHTLSRRKRTSCNSFVLTVDVTAHLAVCRRKERSERGRKGGRKRGRKGGRKRGRKGGRKRGRNTENNRERGEGKKEICYKHVKMS